VITLGLALLIGLTIYVGVRWQLQSLAGYFTAVVVALGLWASAFTLQTYTAILPLLLGALASLLLALVGLRSALRARQDDHGQPEFWVLGVCLVVAPFIVIVVRWLGR
jgi:di/tricarboxylate transporter